MIEFKNVYMRYNSDFFTLFDANFSLSDHTIFIGDDYLGTGSIMRLIAKIDKPIKGEILYENKNINQINDKELDISYITKKPIFIGNNLFNNLYYPLKIRKINKKSAQDIINNELTKYNLANLNKNIKKLNINEQKIISLIRAKIRQPKYFLIEHFFDNLDVSYHDLANKIILDIAKYSTIIATEKNNYEIYNNLNFETINLDIK